MWDLYAVRATLGVALALSACRSGPAIELPPDAPANEPRADRVERVRPAMGTFVEVLVPSPPSPAIDAAIERAFAEVTRVEAVMNEWRPESQLSQVNAAAGRAPVEVDADLFTLLTRALDFADATRGAFDPTFAALWGLWTFGDDGVHRVPSDADVEARRRLIGYRRVVLDPAKRTVFLEASGLKLGLGGIAKGYAVDRMYAAMSGIDEFLIHAGGEMRARGAFRVGIRDPRGPGEFARIELKDEAMSTSGDYERYFEVDGVRYHHIIDPRTGRPATASRSVSIVAKDSLTADALAKAVFILGPKEGLEVAARFGVEALIVDAENRVHTSPGLTGRLELRAPSP